MLDWPCHIGPVNDIEKPGQMEMVENALCEGDGLGCGEGDAAAGGAEAFQHFRNAVVHGALKNAPVRVILPVEAHAALSQGVIPEQPAEAVTERRSHHEAEFCPRIRPPYAGKGVLHGVQHTPDGIRDGSVEIDEDKRIGGHHFPAPSTDAAQRTMSAGLSQRYSAPESSSLEPYP